MVPQVCQDQWELKVPRDQLGSPAPLACQVLAKQENLEFQAAEDHLVPPEQLVRRESQVQQALLASQEHLDQWVQLGHRVQEDSKVKEAQQDPRVTPEWSEHQAQEEPRVNRELRVLQENQVPPVQ